VDGTRSPARTHRRRWQLGWWSCCGGCSGCGCKRTVWLRGGECYGAGLYEEKYIVELEEAGKEERIVGGCGHALVA
jgi:hypothetical protein